MASAKHRRFEVGTFLVGLGLLAVAAYLIGMYQRQEVRHDETVALGLLISEMSANGGGSALFDPKSRQYVVVGMYPEGFDQVVRPLGISRSAAKRIESGVMQTGVVVWNDNGVACYSPLPWLSVLGSRSLTIDGPVVLTVGSGQMRAERID
jgi:hypothetical protein